MFTRNLRNQRGDAMLIIVVIVALVIIGGILWYATHYSKSVATTPAAKSTQSACMKLYNDNTICNFAVTAAAFSTTGYTATATSTANGTNTSLTIKNDGKGNTAVTTSAAGQTESYITLNGNTYLQQPGGSWVEYPASSSPAPGTTTNPTSNIKFNFSAGSQQSTFKKLDTESCGNLTCIKYQVTDPSSPGNTFNVWIDTTKYQMQRWQSTMSDGSSINMNFTYGTITISTPSPVTTL